LISCTHFGPVGAVSTSLESWGAIQRGRCISDLQAPPSHPMWSRIQQWGTSQTAPITISTSPHYYHQTSAIPEQDYSSSAPLLLPPSPGCAYFAPRRSTPTRGFFFLDRVRSQADLAH
jgi:hypothetical protein